MLFPIACSSVDLVPEGDSLQRSEDCTTPAEEGLAIFNGGVCYPADLLPSSVATYQCDPGFCLDVPSMEQGRCVDSYNRTCQANQMFSLQTATCIRKFEATFIIVMLSSIHIHRW